jgi:hypothetical protein
MDLWFARLDYSSFLSDMLRLLDLWLYSISAFGKEASKGYFQGCKRP